MTVGQKLSSIWRFGRLSLKKPQTLCPTVDQTPLETSSEHYTCLHTSFEQFYLVMFYSCQVVWACLYLCQLVSETSFNNFNLVTVVFIFI